MMKQTDVVIVGAGIMGLAHAFHAARKGLSVAVFERNDAANGASIRNFGMLAIVAQAEGAQLASAMGSLAYWQEVAKQADFELIPAGCLFLARRAAEMQVLEEFVSVRQSSSPHRAGPHQPVSGNSEKIVKPRDLAQYANGLRTENLLGGVWSNDAWKLDQREVVAKIAHWLQKQYGVSIYFETEVTEVTSTGPGCAEVAVVSSINQTGSNNNCNVCKCSHVVVCGGDEFSGLFSEEYSQSGVMHCDLQMLRTAVQPASFTLQPFILGGLSLSRYSAFESCVSLPELRQLQRERYSDYLEHGIHVIACQEPDGSITIGDSHSYVADYTTDRSAKPLVRSAEVDRLILQDFDSMMHLPDQRIEHRWIGSYAYNSEAELLRFSPQAQVTVVTATNGQGMTHAFSIAEDVIRNIA